MFALVVACSVFLFCCRVLAWRCFGVGSVLGFATSTVHLCWLCGFASVGFAVAADKLSGVKLTLDVAWLAGFHVCMGYSTLAIARGLRVFLAQRISGCCLLAGFVGFAMVFCLVCISFLWCSCVLGVMFDGMVVMIAFIVVVSLIIVVIVGSVLVVVLVGWVERNGVTFAAFPVVGDSLYPDGG